MGKPNGGINDSKSDLACVALAIIAVHSFGFCLEDSELVEYECRKIVHEVS